MEKLINGRRYNTKTAQRLHSYTKNQRKETLYCKRTGEFFLTVEKTDKTSQPFGVFYPLTLQEATTWAKQKGVPNQYAYLFDKDTPYPSKQTISVTIDGRLLDALDRRLENENQKRSDWLNARLAEWLAEPTDASSVMSDHRHQKGGMPPV